MNKYCVIVFALFCTISVHATVRLPALVGDHMVLQREKKINLWGYANPGEPVTINFVSKIYHTVTDLSGKWKIRMGEIKAGGPYQMTITGENVITVNDILIGDVWICSGQSNMEFPVSLGKNADQEIKNANYPTIRLFNVNKRIALSPLEDTYGRWATCSSSSIQNFPAIGYFFGRDIQHAVNVPIGLINASWGGTVIESWISKEGLADEPTFGIKAKQVATFDTSAYNKIHHQLHGEWVANFNSQDKGLADGKYIWAGKVNDIAYWKKIKLPIIWDFTGLPDLWEMSGIVWFKKTINLTQADIKNDAYLSLGFVMNADKTFINGTEIGNTPDIWNFKRYYKIPFALLKAGENEITVRVENYGGDGGFADNRKLFFLKISADSINLSGDWRYKIGYILNGSDRPEKEFGPNTSPTLMYNNMISPLVNLSIKGVLWYQGEANWFRAYQYRELFSRMINDWRAKFGQGDFPFLYVQLAGYHRKLPQPQASTYWAELREAQDVGLNVNNTGMVTAFDIGDSSNVHPKNKQEVARRLVLLAEKLVYHLPVSAQAPRYKSFEIKGNEVIVETGESAIDVLKHDKITGFQIAGADRKFYWANAELLNPNEIRVFSEKVKQPVAVRYAWEDNPTGANVYNANGLPLFPFRTDTWKGLTNDNK